MRTETLLKTIYFAGMFLEVLLRLPYDRERRRRRREESRVTGTERAALAALSLGSLVLPLLHSLTGWLRFADCQTARRWRAPLGGAGAALMAAAVWLFWQAHRDLGPYWSPSLEIAEGQELVTRGVYSRVRHPMYSSQLLWSLAQPLLLQNWVAGPSGMAGLLLFLLLRVPAEERLMEERFGAAYRAYRARVGALLPRLPCGLPRPPAGQPPVAQGSAP